MHAAKDELPKVVPEVRRRFRLKRSQWILVPLLMAIPLAALLGAFGVRSARAEAFGRGLHVLVDYPARFRYKQLHPLRIEIRNTSASALRGVVVRFDPRYIERFSAVAFTPEPQAAYEVAVGDVPPGETRLAVAELQAEQFGRHEGTIEIMSADGAVARAAVSTRVFP